MIHAYSPKQKVGWKGSSEYCRKRVLINQEEEVAEAVLLAAALRAGGAAARETLAMKFYDKA